MNDETEQIEMTREVVADADASSQPWQRTKRSFNIKSLMIVVAIVAILLSSPIFSFFVNLLVLSTFWFVSIPFFSMVFGVIEAVERTLSRSSRGQDLRTKYPWFFADPLTLSVTTCLLIASSVMLIPTDTHIRLLAFMAVFLLVINLAGPYYAGRFIKSGVPVPHGVLTWAWMAPSLPATIAGGRTELGPTFPSMTLILVLILAGFYPQQLSRENQRDNIAGWIVVLINVFAWAMLTQIHF